MRRTEERELERKRELLTEEAIQLKGGACKRPCRFRQGALIVRFPAQDAVVKITAAQASVRVVCKAVGGRIVKTKHADHPCNCPRFQRKLRQQKKKAVP